MNTFLEIPASKKSLARRKPVFGFGINDSSYITNLKLGDKTFRCPYYSRWKGMLQRCYSLQYQEKYPTYIGCSVSVEWLLFSNFKRWMKKNDWEGKALDKDLLSAGNKVYSPEFCVFVSEDVNLLLIDSEARRGQWPQGVSFNKPSKKFLASCGVGAKHKTIGRYRTPEEASAAYNNFKSARIRKIAKDYIDDARLYNGLINHAELILNKA